MRYLEFEENQAGRHSRKPLDDLLKENALWRFLGKLGYRTVAIETGYDLTDIRNADIFYPYQYQGFNDFEYLLINSTGIRFFFKFLRIDTSISGNQKHRDRIRYEIELLEKIPKLSGPKFVFVHIVAPHPPFVFDSQGNPVNDDQDFWLGDGSRFPGEPQDYIKEYRQQIVYINDLLKEAIESILANSPQPPVILLQGDHGPGSHLRWESFENTCHQERFSILNAYYFPHSDFTQLYDRISPVNSFRVVLNKYFQAKLEILADRQYFSTLTQPYDFIDAQAVSEATCKFARKQSDD